jgi:hypothetical protein
VLVVDPVPVDGAVDGVDGVATGAFVAGAAAASDGLVVASGVDAVSVEVMGAMPDDVSLVFTVTSVGPDPAPPPQATKNKVAHAQEMALFANRSTAALYMMFPFLLFPLMKA